MLKHVLGSRIGKVLQISFRPISTNSLTISTVSMAIESP